MKLRTSYLAASLFAFAAAASPLSAQTLGVNTHGTPDEGSAPGYTLGYQFTVSAPTFLTGLAYYDAGQDGLNVSHDVGLWTESGTMIASATVAAGTGAGLLGDFRTVMLSSSLLLNAGTYRVGGVSDGDLYAVFYSPDGYITSAPTISYTGFTYDECGSGLCYPTGLGNDESAYAYFGGNIVVDSEVTPEPASLVLLGTGLAGIVGFARRRKTAK